MIKRLKIDGNNKILDPKKIIWTRLMCFTQWTSSGHCSVVFGPLEDTIRVQILETIKGTIGELAEEDPCRIHVAILEAFICIWDLAVWDLQPLVKAVESAHAQKPLKVSLSDNAPIADYPRLHEILRYALHHAECLKVGVESINRLVKSHDLIMHAIDKRNIESKAAIGACQSRLDFLSQLFYTLQIRAESYKDRMINEINLVRVVNETKAWN